jgi:transposase
MVPGLAGRAPPGRTFRPLLIIGSEVIRTGAARMVQLGELMMILDFHRQGLSISAIARRTGRDPKTVRKYIERGLEPSAYGPRQAGRPSKLAPKFSILVWVRSLSSVPIRGKRILSQSCTTGVESSSSSSAWR